MKKILFLMAVCLQLLLFSCDKTEDLKGHREEILTDSNFISLTEAVNTAREHLSIIGEGRDLDSDSSCYLRPFKSLRMIYGQRTK